MPSILDHQIPLDQNGIPQSDPLSAYLPINMSTPVDADDYFGFQDPQGQLLIMRLSGTTIRYFRPTPDSYDSDWENRTNLAYGLPASILLARQL